MTKRLSRFILLVIFIIIPNILSIAQQYNFQYFSVDQGLVQSQVNTIFEDKMGILWFGTNSGVSKYNGYEFENITLTDGLVNNRVKSIFQDKKGRLWFGTLGGVSVYNHEKMFNYTKADGLIDNAVLSIFEDKNGTIWLGTQNGLCKYLDNKISPVTSFYKLMDESINAISQDKEGNLWFGTENNGLIKFDGNKFIVFDKSNLNVTSNKIVDIEIDSDNKLWVLTLNDIMCYDGKNFINISKKHNLDVKNFTSITCKDDICWICTEGNGALKFDGIKLVSFNEKNGLVNNFVLSVIVDQTNNVWFGTDGGGICKFDSERFRHFTVKNGLANNVVLSILEDKSGKYWFGTYGNGISVYDGTNYIKNYTNKNGLPSNMIYTIIEDKKGNKWIGTKDGGVSKFDGNRFYNFTIKNGLLSNFVRSIIEDSKGNIWIGTSGGGVSKYNGRKFENYTINEGLSSNDITELFEDSRGNIWIGTDDHGVNELCFNENSIQILQFTKDQGLGNNTVFSINEDVYGNIWLGTYGGGLSKYSNRRFKNFTTENGLSSNNIYFILFDDDNNLWTGTDKGVDKISFIYNKDSLIIKYFGADEGLVGIETNINSAFKDSKSNLWFGTINGVSRYDHTADKKDNKEVNLYIKGINFFDKETDWTKYCDSIDQNTQLPINLVLPYDKTENNHLTFDFVGINLKAPKKIKYSWILEGFDKKYFPPTTKHEAVYSNLPPGKYKFIVKACNSDGVWNKGVVTFSFTIKPPFWKSWWFFLIISIILTIIILLYVQFRLFSLQKEKRILESKVKWKTRQLQLEKENLEIKKEELTSQTKQLEVVNKELQKFSVVIKETGNSVIIADNEGNIEWVNEGFIKLYGYSLEEFKKEFSSNIFTASKNKDIMDIMQKSVKIKKAILYESFFPCKNGTFKWVQTSITPVFSKENQLINFALIESDISKIKEAEEKITRQKEELENEKRKTEELLLNVLPPDTVKELMLRGQVTARKYRITTVMFADFEEFTKKAQRMTPNQLVRELNTHFIKFDEIIEKYFIEKIKTIGDAYMCAGGLPIRNKTNPIDVILAAMEFQRYLMNYFEGKTANGDDWGLRIGIHTGPVIAGIVGKKKFAYDIWGDTVNTASRMESGGLVGKINISGETYEYVKEFFDCSHRGKIHAKNIGEIDMYFVDRIKPELSEDNKGIIPNEKFRNILAGI